MITEVGCPPAYSTNGMKNVTGSLLAVPTGVEVVVIIVLDDDDVFSVVSDVADGGVGVGGTRDGGVGVGGTGDGTTGEGTGGSSSHHDGVP